MSFTGTMKRLEYFLTTLLYYALITIAWVIAIPLMSVGTSTASLVVSFIFIIASIAPIVGLWAISVRRLRDIGLNPWFVLAFLVPYVGFAFNLFLLLAPTGAFGIEKAEDYVERMKGTE